jgi:hypothetical protein
VAYNQYYRSRFVATAGRRCQDRHGQNIAAKMEVLMDAENQIVGSPVYLFDAPNYLAMDYLPREGVQSHRLHEPERLLTNIDPITGNDIADYLRHPHHTDGNVTMYFETEETRQAYLDTPVDHPFHLIDNPDDEGIDEG